MGRTAGAVAFSERRPCPGAVGVVELALSFVGGVQKLHHED